MKRTVLLNGMLLVLISHYTISLHVDIIYMSLFSNAEIKIYLPEVKVTSIV